MQIKIGITLTQKFSSSL